MDKDLIRILRESELSKEMKLDIISIVSSAKDEGYISGFIEMLKAWDEADNRLELDLAKKMQEVRAEYDARVQSEGAHLEDGLEQIEAEIENSKEIAKLKESI